jgi:hypothetical protein
MVDFQDSIVAAMKLKPWEKRRSDGEWRVECFFNCENLM